jgi:class 3 adenylate cyclase
MDDGGTAQGWVPRKGRRPEMVVGPGTVEDGRPPYAWILSELSLALKDRSLSKDELVRRFVNILGPGLDVSRACYNELTTNVYVTVVEWVDQGVRPTIGHKLPVEIVEKLLDSDVHLWTRQTAVELLPKGLRFIAGPVLSVMEILQNIAAIVVCPVQTVGEIRSALSLDICRDGRRSTNWPREKLDFFATVARLLGDELERRRLVSPLETSPEAAILVLDLVESTSLLVDFGDTLFIDQVNRFHREFMEHPSADDLLFLKNTGDGFLGIYRNVPQALAAAREFLERGSVRVALHWGAVNTGLGGDPLGVEVHRAFRIDGVREEDRADSAPQDRRLPASGRILATRQVLEQLGEKERRLFEPVGGFRLRGFAEPCPLWLAVRSEGAT